MRRQLPALGLRNPDTSTRCVLMRVLGPTRCLAGFLADAKNLLNGLVREIPQTRQRHVPGLIISAHDVLPF